ncbi:MAG TPA: energy-coupling factor transporter ATPase [Clostridiales bacterium]|nr:energy-coupling factor transporter ATPase [Clostridiales bacterium]
MSIEVKDLSYVYSPGTPYAAAALNGVTVTVDEGDFLGIIGKTGSGKSTFIQHLNALIRLQTGSIKVYDVDLTQKKPDLKKLRGTVGMVMQYPEYQLFDETVEKDVAYGPKNLGLSEEEIKGRVREAIELVGLSYEEVRDRSPFELSGGQKRRVAIAGVIAMRPRVLILDEPTAGLDPRGKKDIMSLVKKLKETSSPTIIIISHDMDAVAENCDKVALFSEGKILSIGSPREVFYDESSLALAEMDVPSVVKIAKEMKKQGVCLAGDPVKKTELVEAIRRWRNE